MFSFPEKLREHGLNADVRTILEIVDSINTGLISNLGDLYAVGRVLIVKDRTQLGPFTEAFFDHFLGIEIEPGYTLDMGVTGSTAYQKWLPDFLQASGKSEKDLNTSETVDMFLDYVLSTSDNFHTLITGEKLLEYIPEGMIADVKVDGKRVGSTKDFSKMDLKRMRRWLKKIAKKQDGIHMGGKYWIGVGGKGAFGYGGTSKGGIRIGGTSYGQSARLVIGDRAFYPVDVHQVLGDDNIDAAFAALKGVTEQSSRLELDVDRTIKEGINRGGIFFPVMHEVITEKRHVMLFIDNGGHSMEVYVGLVRELFQKMKTRFTHDLKVFYFHNTLSKMVYEDEKRINRPVPLERILDFSPDHRVFIVGDASMDPEELLGTRLDRQEGPVSIEYWKQLVSKFPRIAWLNPVEKSRWDWTDTIDYIARVIPMFSLTPYGIEEAVNHMNRKRHD